MSKPSIDTKTIEAMKLCVQWRDMMVFCNQRTVCKGCSFFDAKYKLCNKYSTVSILEHCADVFQEYFIENGII